MLQIILLYALYGVVFIFSKEALLFSKPIFATGFRMVFAGICSYFLYKFWAKPVKWSSVTWYHIWYIFLLAFFNVYLTNANETWSLQYLSAGKVAFIYNLSPFFSLFFSHFMFKEKFTWKKIVGMIIACIAITPLLVDDTSLDVVDSTYRIGFLSIAEIVMIIASAATAYGWIIMKYLMELRSDFSSYFLNATSLVVGGILCFMQSWFFEVQPYVLSGYENKFLFYISIMMLIQNLIAYNYNSYLLTIHSATLVILFSFVMPIITAILEFFMFGEQLTMEFFTCSLGVAIGLVIFYFEELKEDRPSKRIS
ncbi:EamA family transporter [Candidatus Dependentiae bacterium]|nr:EamA family transporter [Candidatus Dependentiae bacterium]